MGGLALVVIDVQNGVLDGPPAVPHADALLATLAGLIARARAAGVPVVFVQDDEVGAVGSAAWQLHPAIAPRADEPVVHKLACDAFHGTTLAEILHERGVDTIVAVGLKTEFCFDTTCRRAVTLGFGVRLVADAHGSHDGPVLSAAQKIAHHNALLEGFGVTGAEISVVPAAEVGF